VIYIESGATQRHDSMFRVVVAFVQPSTNHNRCSDKFGVHVQVGAAPAEAIDGAEPELGVATLTGVAFEEEEFEEPAGIAVS